MFNIRNRTYAVIVGICVLLSIVFQQPVEAADPDPASTTEYVVNGGFENGNLSPWAGGTISSIDCHSGSFCVTIKTVPGGQIYQKVMNLQPNTTYVLTGYAKTDNGMVRIGVQNYNGTSPIQYQDISSNTYTRGRITFTTGATSTAATIIMTRTAGSGGLAYGDDFSVVKKSAQTAEDWTINVDASTDNGVLTTRPELNHIRSFEDPRLMELPYNYSSDTLHVYANDYSQDTAGISGNPISTNFERLLKYVTDQSKYYKNVSVAISGLPVTCVVNNVLDYDCYEMRLKETLTAIKEKEPKFIYYETQNEGNNEYKNNLDQYVEMYKRSVNAANYVNSTVSNGPALQVGPNFSLPSSTFTQSFLDKVVTNHIKIDFYSYHNYGSRSFDSGQDQLQSDLRSRGLSSLPLHLTEYGYNLNGYNSNSPLVAANSEAAVYSAHYAAMSTFYNTKNNILAATHFYMLNQSGQQHAEYRLLPVSSQQTGGVETYNFPQQRQARYVLIVPNSELGVTPINEIEVYDSAGVKLNADAMDYPALTDGDPSTAYTSPKVTYNPIYLDLGFVQNVASLRINFANGSANAYQFVAWTSEDDVEYTPALGQLVPTPIGNIMKMQVKMPSTVLTVTGNSTDAARREPIAFATKDDNHVAVLLHNYQIETYMNDYNLTLNTNNLPAGFNGKKIRYEIYAVDATHGNTYYDPSQTVPQLIESGTKSSSSDASFHLYMPINSVFLVTLSPVIDEETFADGNDTLNPMWNSVSGAWSAQDESGNYVYKVSNSNEPSAVSVLSSTYLNDYTAEARVRPDSMGSSGAVTLYARYSDSNNNYVVSMTDKKLSIMKHVNGVQSILKRFNNIGKDAIVDYPIQPGAWYLVKTEVIGSLIRVYVNDDIVLTAVDPDASQSLGKFAIGTFNATASFDDIILTGQSLVPNPTNVLQATLTGQSAVQSGDAFSTNFGLSNVSDNVYAADITIKFDASAVDYVSIEPLKFGFTVLLTQTAVSGQIRILAVSEGATGALTTSGDVFKLNWKAKSLDQSVTTNMELAKVTVANALGQKTESLLTDLMVNVTAIVTVPGDVNGDSVIDIGDLGKIAANYGKTMASPDWNQILICDFNYDGKIDIIDLAAIAHLILQ